MKGYVKPALLVLIVLVAVTSLVLSGLTLYGFLRFREAGLATVKEARTALSDLTESGIQISVPLRDTFPVHASVPLRQEFAVPIRTTIPLSTTARVPIEIPIVGTYRVAVPVETQVPIDLEVVVPVSETLEVETAVALSTEVAVQVEMEQLGLGDLLEEIDGALAEVERGLQWPLSPRRAP
ncbi:MAG: hypothetical protein PVH62_07705 [Anaerolineae bacterium]|jgi:hypothetical protein